jgi:hypothetical protein
MIIAFLICVNFSKKFDLLPFSLPLAVIFSLSYYSLILLLLPFSGMTFDNIVVSNLIIYSGAFFFFVCSAKYFRHQNHNLSVSLRTLLFPATGSVFFVFFLLLISIRHPGGELSWAMSGDARNHLLLALKIIESNGITYEIMSTFPMLSNALVSLLSSSVDRPSFKTGDLLSLDLNNLMLIWLIGFLLTSYIFGRLIFEYKHYLQLNKYFIWTLSSILSLIPFSGFFLTISIFDGFLSATWGFLLMICLSYLNLFARVEYKLSQSFILVVINLLGIILAILIWTPILFIIAPITFYIILRHLKTISKNYLYLLYLLPLILISFLLFSIPLSGSPSVGLDGAGNFPRYTLVIMLLLLLGFLLLIYAYVTKVAKLDFNYSLLLFPFLPIPTLALVIIFIMSKREPDQSKWSYYSLKILWQYDMLLIFFMIVIIIGILNNTKKFVYGLPSMLTYVSMTSAVLLIPSLLFHVSPAQNSIRLISQGWNFPNSTIVTEILQVGNSLNNQEVLFWKNSVHPNNDRLGNFWLALYDKNSKPYSFAVWAYYSNQVDANFLCELLENQPNRKIITSQKSETLEDLATCEIEIPDATKVFFNK